MFHTRTEYSLTVIMAKLESFGTTPLLQELFHNPTWEMVGQLRLIVIFISYWNLVILTSYLDI